MCLGRGVLQSAAVGWIVYMTFGAAHESSSSLFVFFWPDWFNGLDNLARIADIMFFETHVGGEEKLDEKAFEQSGADISVGLIVKFPPGADSFDMRLERKVKNSLDIV